MIKRYTLSKEEKLKSKKSIERLFSEGKSFVQHPIRIVYIKNETSDINQVAFSVSKRNFKLAVDRNRVKRLMREAYRLNKYDLNEKGFDFILIYTSRKIKSYLLIETSIKTILEKLEKK
ncbi:ribonuclease P [Flavobacteriaceae bacterium UJ101]|nr:ribonuclease P [Flavobacteriaceae bacterium UJ101]